MKNLRDGGGLYSLGVTAFVRTKAVTQILNTIAHLVNSDWSCHFDARKVSNCERPSLSDIFSGLE